PRLLVAQIPMSQWGNQESLGPSDFIEVEKKYEIISGKDGIIHAVRDRKRSGSDFIKTMTSGGVLHGMGSELERSLWTDEEMSALVCEAHRLGMHVAVHAHGNHGILKAAEAGVDTIEHCSFVDDESAKTMIKNKVHLVPTQTSAFLDKPEIMKQLPPEVAQKTTEVDEAMFKNHKLAFELGVKIALGTDAGVPGNPHGTSARELTSMVKHIDITPVQAIQIGTIEAARAIKLDDKIGSIEIGKSADLIIVSGNVLENVALLESRDNIDYVIKDGDILARKGLFVN
ncbi:MAG: amidohydrolase family protein, partial [Candidatus Heimdallarchaeota archaeon]